MTDKQTFFLRNEQVRSNCQSFIQDLPTDDKKPLVVKIQVFLMVQQAAGSLSNLFNQVSLLQ